jgi:DNA-directed RNA polymerase alpha subunit
METQQETAIEALDLSVRAYNCLQRSGITTVEQVAALSDGELLNIRNVGVKVLGEIQEKLVAYLAEYPLPERPGEVYPEVSSDHDPATLVGDRLPEQPESIGVLGLSRRSFNRLQQAGIDTVEQLAAMSDADLLDIPGLGVNALAEIRGKLAAYLVTHQLLERPVSIEILDLSPRSYNLLRRNGIRTLAQLAQISPEEIRNFRNVGEKIVKEIMEKLEAYLAGHPLSLSEQLVVDKPKPSASPQLSVPVDKADPLPPLVDPTLLARAAQISLENIPLDRLALPLHIHNQLRQRGIGSVGELAQQPTDIFGPISPVREQLILYITWLVEQSEDAWEDEVAGRGMSPLYSLMLGGMTWDDLVAQWLEVLDERECQILQWRYGFVGEALTLEEIGQLMKLTRERVRQIEARTIRKLCRPAQRYVVQSLVQFVREVLLEAGGVSTETQISEAVAEDMDIDEIDPQGVVRLLLSIYNEFVEIKEERAWGLADLPLESVAKINKYALELLAAERAPLTKDELLARLKGLPWYQEYVSQLDDAFILACINVSAKIICRDDGCYGLEKWQRYYQDDIIVALRRLGRPAHYSEIAGMVNASLPENQHITPRAVHIRLMQHPELFVWVGRRGTYGLKEWGVKRALSYKETLVEILRRAGHPLTFQQILAQLPTFRPYYDENSIVLTLGTNELFRTFPDGTYGLAEWREEDFTEDYRLQRLFDGVETIPSTTRPKARVIEALDGVDSFIARAREKANDEY